MTFIMGLSLPTISMLVGKAITSKSFPGMSQWKRTLVGGLAYLSVKCLVKVYYRYTQLVRSVGCWVVGDG